MPTGDRPPPGPRIVRVAVSGAQGGVPWANVFWCQTDEPGIDSNAGAQDFADAFHTALTGAAFYELCQSPVSVTQIRCVIQLDGDTAVVGTNSTVINGTGSGTTLPANECIVVSWQTAAYWRGGKPRTYIPGVANSAIDTNHSLADSAKATWVAKALSVRTHVNAITTPAVDQTELGFLSFATGGEWRSDPVFFAFSGATIHDRLGTQRRRLGPWLP